MLMKPDITQKEAKKMLEELLDDYEISSKVSVEDIENLILYAKSTDLLHRVIDELLKMIGDKNDYDRADFERISGVIYNCWNGFPHKDLGYLSPIEMYLSSKEKAAIKKSRKLNKPAKPKRFSDVFKRNESLDEESVTAKIVHFSDDDYAFEFSTQHYDKLDEYDRLKESKYGLNRHLKLVLKLMKEDAYLYDAMSDACLFFEQIGEIELPTKIFQVALLDVEDMLDESDIPLDYKLPWGVLDNRPYLRLLNNYANFLMRNIDPNEGMMVYEHLIALNPNDNQGIRAILADLYLEFDQPQKVITLSKIYPESHMANLDIGLTLAYFKLGKFKKARKSLEQNKEMHMRCLKEFTKKTHRKPKNLLDDRYQIGGADEAYYFWRDQGKSWLETEGAVEFVKENL